MKNKLTSLSGDLSELKRDLKRREGFFEVVKQKQQEKKLKNQTEIKHCKKQITQRTGNLDSEIDKLDLLEPELREETSVESSQRASFTRGESSLQAQTQIPPK